MADETTPETQLQAQGATHVPEGVDASIDNLAAPNPQATSDAAASEANTADAPVADPAAASQESPPAEPEVPATPEAPDAIQPFIDQAFDTVQQEVDAAELGQFLRAHIKTFREEWDSWSDSAKDAYVHMITSQLLTRKAAGTHIRIGNEFKWPVPSAQATLFESLKRSQVKPPKRQPVLLMPPNLRPTYALKG